MLAELLSGIDGRLEGIRIETHSEAVGALMRLLRPADGDCRLREGQVGLLMTCLRLLWAGYYREVILQERSRTEVEECRAEAIRRFK